MPARVLVVALLAFCALPSAALSAERWESLQALPRLALQVTVSPNHHDLSTEDIRRRLEEALHRVESAPSIDPASADRLHLVVAVRSYSSSELRGYYLPLSQAYGIGPVRLIVERPAQITGLAAPVPVLVWWTERQAKGPWKKSAAEIMELVDEVVTSFLADYRRALGQ